MYARTDASVKNGISTHSYVIRHHKGKLMYEHSFKWFEDNSAKAELTTIEKLLQFIYNKGYENVRIYTDYQDIVKLVKEERNGKNINTEYLRFLLKQTRSKLSWNPREKNKECDKNCRDVFGIYKAKTKYGKKGVLK